MPLLDLLQQARDPKTVVAWRWDATRGASSPIRWRRFRADVAGLRDRLSAAAPGRWLLATDEAYPFAVGAFALWHAGRSAISPPNHQPGTLERLATEAVGVVSDRPEWFESGDALVPGAQNADADLGFDALSPDAPAVELFTSGTTGAGKSVAKRISNLEEEVVRLEALFGSRVEGATILGTASHQHLYGMLFRVLWPLAYGHAFQSDVALHTSELIARMRERKPCAFASVPSHLKRMVRQKGVAELGRLCRSTFSSGGMLQTDTAQAWKQKVGEAPIEVFGSTETGGVAWRAQNELPNDLGWTLFPDVELDGGTGDDGLRVRSPYVTADPESAGVTIGDRIRWLPDGRFALEGRADRVVKIGEKRVDLSMMESALRGHDLVEEAALLAIDFDGDARVAAVVVPTAEGRALLEREGRAALGRTLADSLAPNWDRVVLPRAWRTVDALPENAQGKVAVSALRALFDSPNGRPKSAPEVDSEERSSDTILQRCSVPDDLPCFEGHFEGFPVVPGVVQIGWALEVARELAGTSLTLHEIEALKFARPLLPGARFLFEVRRRDAGKYQFRLFDERGSLSSGRLCVSAGAAR